MDANTIRLILIIAGALLILMLYLWERHHEQTEQDGNDDDFEEDDAVAEPYGIRKDQREPTLGAMDDDGAERTPVWSGLASRFKRKSAPEATSAPATEPRPIARTEPKLEPLLIQISVVTAPGKLIEGLDLMDLAESCGLHPGQMSIFHCLDEFVDETKIYFSMASVVKPGTFPFDAMEDFSTPGVMLFARMRGDPEDMTTLDEMIATARKLAISVNGNVLDNTRRPLTVKKQEDMRQTVLANQLRWAKANPQ